MKDENIKKTRVTTETDTNPANRDPITGAPGAHPVGAGVGAAAGGATGAAIGAVGGPVGAAVGLVAGGIIGGLAGKAAGEGVNPTVEDAYWRETHSTQTYAKGRPYDTYAGAYRTGYEGYSKYSTSGKTFEQSEADLRRDYDTYRGQSALTWDEAKHASRAAWQRVDENTRMSEAGSTSETPRYNAQGQPTNRQQQGERYEPKERGKTC